MSGIIFEEDEDGFYQPLKKPPSPPRFEELVENAFDFLEKAIEQFKKEPKYSIINFCSAVELLLKARLMHEHWSLIVDTKKGHPDLNAFMRGDFKSIDFVELAPRIKAAIGSEIPQDAVHCFETLAKHRNKMIHFFHEAHTLLASEELMEKIAIEQSSGWFYLQRLLKAWDNVFSAYDARVSKINGSMKDHEVYLNTVFERVKPEIIKETQAGAVFVLCNVCKKMGSEEAQETDYIYSYKCRVCSLEDEAIKISCEEDDCKGNVILEEGLSEYACSDCDSKMSRKDVEEKLDTEISDYADHVRKNCALCSEMGSVVEHEQYYICTNCFYFTKEYGVCEWCNEGQIGGGDLDGSNWSGCEFCDGHAGHMRDRDD